MSTRHRSWVAFTLIVTFCFVIFPSAMRLAFAYYSSSSLVKMNEGGLRAADSGTRDRVNEAYGKLPLSFEANVGQFDARVKFASRGSGYSLSLAQTEAVLALRGGKSPLNLRMKFTGANPHAKIEGEDPLPGKSNYLIGKDRRAWRTGVEHFAQVRYQNIYRGIDLIFYGVGRQLEYDFIIAPGANPRDIKLRFDGAERIRIEADGDLAIQTASGEIRQQKPIVYQDIKGERRFVAGQYVRMRARQVGFSVAAYDHSLPLVIDPTLSYTTYLGGNGRDSGSGIALDAAGNLYITGTTNSTDFPITAGALQTSIAKGPCSESMASLACVDVFVTKLNATSTELVYSTYFGGGGGVDRASDIAVDAAGNAYITGITASSDFPTTPGAFQTTPPDRSNAFVTKLNPTGTALVYSTYLGGSSENDWGYGIEVDAAGNAHIVGETSSIDFPTAQAWQPFLKGFSDAFIAKLNSSGSGLVYSTYLGGDRGDLATDLALDASANVYVTGYTRSTDFPTFPGIFRLRGQSEAFVTKFNAAGTELVYSTQLGGDREDYGVGIAVDSGGNAYIVGSTLSANFPTTPGAFQTAPTRASCIDHGVLTFCTDGFVTKLNASGTNMLYSTLLSGMNNTRVNAIALDKGGNAYIAGEMGGPFVAKLNPSGSAFSYFVPAPSYGDYTALVADDNGNVYGTGAIIVPRPSSLDIPYDAVIAKISAGGNVVGVSVSAASYHFPSAAIESLAVLYGSRLATTTLAASTVPIPTSLGGTTVMVKDSAGVERLAPLLFVSPGQINYQIPPETAVGPGIVTVTNGDGDVASGILPVRLVFPGLFSANANGSGVAAAVVLRVKEDGSRQFEVVAQYDQTQRQFVAKPIDLGPATDRLFLVLFATGLRFRSSIDAVRVSIGGIGAPALYAGPQPTLAGVDQINVELPRNLAGKGEVSVGVTVDNHSANTVKIAVK